MIQNKRVTSVIYVFFVSSYLCSWANYAKVKVLWDIKLFIG